jgi:hypothetical protein
MNTMGTNGELEQRHSFVVTIWREETPAESPGRGWRGHITHVPSGERRYLRRLCEIVSFVTAYTGSFDPAPKRRGTLAKWWACCRNRSAADPCGQE